MRKQNIINIVFIIISLSSIALSGYLYLTRQKIIIINNNDLLSNYKATKENKELFEKEVTEIQKNLTSLENEINDMLKKLQEEYPTLSKEEQKKQGDFIKKKQEEYYKYKEEVIQKNKDKEDELSAAIYNQVNSFMDTYGKTEKADLIIGVTDMGNVLFANENLDKTDEVIDKLNKKYAGE